MALKATVFKCDLNVSDMDRHYYGHHSLTLARHPSENDLRMMVRLLVFALHAHEDLSFSKGLSNQEEPDIWQKNLRDEIECWIDLGQVEEKRLRQACGKAKQVSIYTYNDKQTGPWQQQNQSHFQRHDNLTVRHISSDAAQQLAELADKSMELQVSIQDGEVFVCSPSGQVSLIPQNIYPA